MGKSTPSTPDPIETSQAQAAANIDTARIQQKLNLIDQYTPYGNLVYTPASQFYGSAPQSGGVSGATSSAAASPTFTGYTADQQAQIDQARSTGNENRAKLLESRYGGGTTGTTSTSGTGGYTTPYDFGDTYADRWVSQVTLPEDSQKAVEASQKFERLLNELGVAQTGRVSDALSQDFSLDTLPAAPTADEASRAAYQQQVLDFYDSRNNPQIAANREALYSRLANQGIAQGSEAWRKATDQFEQQVADSRLAAQTSALQNSGAEMERAFNLGTTARANALQEQLLQRQLPLNEAIALISGTQTQMPSFTSTPQTSVNGTDVSGNIWNAYQADVNAANQSNAATSQLVGGLASLGLGAAGVGPLAGWFGSSSPSGIGAWGVI